MFILGSIRQSVFCRIATEFNQLAMQVRRNGINQHLQMMFDRRTQRVLHAVTQCPLIIPSQQWQPVIASCQQVTQHTDQCRYAIGDMMNYHFECGGNFAAIAKLFQHTK